MQYIIWHVSTQPDVKIFIPDISHLRTVLERKSLFFSALHHHSSTWIPCQARLSNNLSWRTENDHPLFLITATLVEEILTEWHVLYQRFHNDSRKISVIDVSRIDSLPKNLESERWGYERLVGLHEAWQDIHEAVA